MPHMRCGPIVRADSFPMTSESDLRKLTPKWTATCYRQAFPGELLTQRLSALLSDSVWKECTLIRNIVTHRTAPGRHIQVGGPFTPFAGTAHWKLPNIRAEINEHLTKGRRSWLAASLKDALDAANVFVTQHWASQA
jgi:hypothetical protein